MATLKHILMKRHLYGNFISSINRITLVYFKLLLKKASVYPLKYPVCLLKREIASVVDTVISK